MQDNDGYYFRKFFNHNIEDEETIATIHSAEAKLEDHFILTLR